MRIKALFSVFYQRAPEGCMTRRWHAVAYYDYARRERVMVIFPIHYVFTFIHWIGCLWDRFRHRETWIDRQIRAALERDRENRL